MVNGSHMSATQEQSVVFDQLYLVGDEVFTTTLASSSHIEGYPQLARHITGATSPVSMVARWWHTVADSPSPTMARPGKRGYSFYRP